MLDFYIKHNIRFNIHVNQMKVIEREKDMKAISEHLSYIYVLS